MEDGLGNSAGLAEKEIVGAFDAESTLDRVIGRETPKPPPKKKQLVGNSKAGGEKRN